ncbi:outer membrane protein [Devosia naphthalenivorans]|uniref:outer membrane protein n=1 Tax=Devosia naphthalenivorans TaxID=2082392 RepID=UPI000D385AB6|nr:outer membrane protein [Devosia naphthalenivorans]
MKRFGIMLSTTLLLSGAASAADLNWNSGTSSIYSPTSVSDWSGFYAGVNGGFAWGTLTSEDAAGGPETENNSDGFQFGGQAGYNMDMGGFVIGAEADLQWANIGYTEDLPGIGSFESNIDFYGTIRGRAGMAFGAVMPYVTGGFAAGRGTSSVTDAGNVVTSQTANHIGWTVGAGLEAKATDNITFKAEYLYTDLGTQTYNGLPVGNTDVTHNFSVVRAGLNYKF